MSTKIGKTFGLALIMAVGILAVMFALGTFSSQKAGAAVEEDSVTLSVDTTEAGAEVEVTVSYTEDADIEAGGTIEITLTEFDVTGSLNATITGTSDAGNDVEDVTADSANGSAQVVTVILPADIDDTADDPQGLKAGAITVKISGVTNPEDATNAMATVGGVDSEEVGLGVVLDADPKGPGAVSHVSIQMVSGAAKSFGDRIVIDMDKFELPSGAFEAGSVSVRDATNTERVDARKSGTKVTLEVPDMNGEDTDRPSLATNFTVVFSQRAGVTVPSTAGNYSVKISLPDSAATDTDDKDAEVKGFTSNSISVEESLKLDKKSGGSGTEVTVTGKGFKNDITALFIDESLDGVVDNDEYRIATNIDVDKGSFSHTFTIDSNFEAGLNYINTRDDTGATYRPALPEDDPETADDDEMADALATWVSFKVTGKMALDKETAKLGEKVEVTLSNFSPGPVEKVTIGGDPVDIDDGETNVGTNGRAVFEFVIPPDLGTGIQQVKATVDPTDGGDDESATADITVGGLPLTLSPSSAVPGQELIIRGSGFTAKAKVASIFIGGKEADLPSTAILVSNSGNIVATIDVPKDVSGTGEVLVVVKEDGPPDEGANPRVWGNLRTGVANLTINKPTLTLSPDTSRPGTSVTASGTGYVAGANVQIKYGTFSTVTSINADGNGTWTKAFVVPINQNVGTKPTVTAVSGEGVDGEATKTADATHTVPGGKLSIDPTSGQPGARITITANGFKAFSPVTELRIGDLTIPHAGINTDADGDFQTTVTLPALPAGTHSLFVEVGGDDSESLVFTVGEAGPAVLPTAEVFKDLIDAGNLERVYRYVNATATWFVFDPRPDFAEFNDYTESVSRQAVWVKVTNDAQFQGQPLFAGWNQIVLR